MIDEIKSKVQRLLTENFKVRLGKSGQWIISHNSAHVFITVDNFETKQGEIGLIRLGVPLVHSLKPTPELFQWVALEGHLYRLGSVCAYQSKEDQSVTLRFEYNIVGVDIDESELRTAVVALAISSDDLDTELHAKFGGEMFGDDQ